MKAAVYPYKVQAPGVGSNTRLLGVNVDGWLVEGAAPEHYRTFLVDGDLARLANWRLTHVRLPVESALLETEDGWRALDLAVYLCARHGLRVMLALRWHDPAALFASPAGWRGLAERWQRLATRYRDSSAALMFDLLDEPAAPDDVAHDVMDSLGAARLTAAAVRRAADPEAAAGRAWSALAARLTETIRDVDERSTLVVESPRAQPQAFRHLRPTRDAHTIYSFHCFAPEGLTRRGSGVYPGEVEGERWDRERLLQTLQPALAFARTYEATLYLGAFGATDTAPRQSRLTWIRSMLALCRQHGIGWAYWTYRDPPYGLLSKSGVDYDLLGVIQSE